MMCSEENGRHLRSPLRVQGGSPGGVRGGAPRRKFGFIDVISADSFVTFFKCNFRAVITQRRLPATHWLPMPLLRTETIHGFVCKFYDNDVVMVGTASDRFTIKVPADESSWVATRLRAELIKRELATAAELPIDEAGEAAMAARSAAKEQKTVQMAAAKKVAASTAAKKKAAVAVVHCTVILCSAPGGCKV